MRTGWALGVVAALLLTACSSDGTSGSGSSPAVANTGAKATPPSGDYDAQVVLCKNGQGITSHCHGTAATDTQIADVATKLRADSDITAVYYLSAADVEKVDRQALSAAERSQIPANGDRRPELLVTFAGEGSANDDFVDTYAKLPGVDDAQLCVGDDICQVATLRKAGVIG